MHVARLLLATVRYAFIGRRYAVLAALVLGLVLILLTSTAQAAAPLLLYPFA